MHSVVGRLPLADRLALSICKHEAPLVATLHPKEWHTCRWPLVSLMESSDGRDVGVSRESLGSDGLNVQHMRGVRRVVPGARGVLGRSYIGIEFAILMHEVHAVIAIIQFQVSICRRQGRGILEY